MNIDNHNRPSNIGAVYRYQWRLICKYPRLLIMPMLSCLLKLSLVVLVARPFIDHCKSDSHLVFGSAAFFIAFTVVLAFQCLKNLIEAITTSISTHQLIDIIISDKKPRSIFSSIRSIGSRWRNIISWTMFLTLFSRFVALGRRWLYQWQYFIELAGNTNYACSSMLVLPCIILEKSNTRNAYRTIGRRVNAIWGRTPRLKLSQFLLSISLLLIAAIPSVIYFLSGIHQIILMIGCVGFSLLSYSLISSFGKFNRNIIMTLLYHFATNRKNVSKEIDAKRFFVTQNPGMVKTLNTNQATAVTT